MESVILGGTDFQRKDGEEAYSRSGIGLSFSSDSGVCRPQKINDQS